MLSEREIINMEKLISHAEERFEKLWETEGSKLRSGNITPSIIKNGQIYPVDYCISTIARLIHQPNGSEIICGIRCILSDLFKDASNQFIYPDESLHISLLGCTQREKSNQFDCNRINKIKNISMQEIQKKECAKILLRGIGIVGNQIFIQGIPLNRNWEELRTSLDKRLVDAGESPISYEDKSPIHINIIRIIDATPGSLLSLYKTITQLREVELGIIKLQTVELVITDFCVSNKGVIWLDKMECCDSTIK